MRRILAHKRGSTTLLAFVVIGPFCMAQGVEMPDEAVFWDDFETGEVSWAADRAATDLGAFEGEGVDESVGWGVFLNDNSDAFWAARLSTSFDTPEGSTETAWRVRFAAKTNVGPTTVSARLAQGADPYTSTEDVMPTLEIPAGQEGRYFHFDFHIPLSPFLDAERIIFLFGIIGLFDTEIFVDDVYMYPCDAIAMLTFENADPFVVAEANGGDLGQETEDQKEGVYSARLTVSDGGTAPGDAGLVALWTPYPEPYPFPTIGNYRIHVQAKTDVAPLRVQAGVINRTLGDRFASPTEQVVTEADAWQELSFLVRLESEGDEYGVFFATGGQGAHTVAYDLVIIEPTDEVISSVDYWSLQ